jgi:hypothetical protein
VCIVCSQFERKPRARKAIQAAGTDRLSYSASLHDNPLVHAAGNQL